MTADLAQIPDPAGGDLRQVPSLPGYFAAADGTVWSMRSGAMRCLAESLDHDGYPTVRVFVPGRRRPKRRKVPRIIAEAFHGPRPADLQIRHLDGDPENNRPTNLKYGTALENAQDRGRHGTRLYGVACHNASVPDEVVTTAVSMVIAGHSYMEVSTDLGVTDAEIYSWCHGKSRADATAHLDLSLAVGKRSRGDHSGHSKVTERQIAEMRGMRDSGVKLNVIAGIYSLHPATVSKLTRGLGRRTAS